MSKLIEEFKKEHIKIIEAIKEVETLGILTKGGHAKLMSLILDLLNHLWGEDEWLYPVLRKESEHNKTLQEILRIFVNGLGALHGEILNFVTKYSQGVIDSNFQIECKRIFGALRKRIECEENTLYDEYDVLYH